MRLPADEKKPELGTVRDHLLEAAKEGSETAIRQLESAPVCPEPLRHLVEITFALFGRSGVGFIIAPLSPVVLESYLRQIDDHLAPHEFKAVLFLDQVYRSPDEFEELEEEPVRRITPAWPTKKNEGSAEG